MSDSLKDRLASHSGAFEGLLSLIPAKYYYEDDTKSQLKNGDDTSAKASEPGRSKKAKAASDSGSSALEEMKRREGAPLSGDEEEDDVPIFDDHGNQISGPKELSIQDILRSKSLEDPSPASLNGSASSEQARKPAEQKPNGKREIVNAAERADKPKKDTKPAVAPSSKTSKSDSLPNSGSPDVNGVAGGNSSAPKAETAAVRKGENSHAANGASAASEHPPQAAQEASSEGKKGIAELRAKLAARISEMRAKRKAPGSSAPGAPKNREELLLQRKLRQEQKQKTQSLKRKRDGDASDDEGRELDEVDGDGSASSGQNLMFGQVEFTDGARLGRDLNAIEEKRRVKRRNATDQLRVLESRKAKIDELGDDKKKQINENAKWSRAILQSEGAKIRDDEKLLRKTLRTKERQKSKSAKEWRDRKETVANDIAKREAKRTANIKAHREAKQLRLKGKKRKEHMKRAGFEGRHR